MNRRQFISLLTATGSTSILSSAVANVFPQGDICRSRPVAEPRLKNAKHSDELVIAGTRLFKEGFLDEILPLYSSATGKVATMLGGGCDDGVAGVRLGSAHLGGVCCPLDSHPTRGLHGYQIAKDMKVVIAHPSVQVDSLSMTQLKGVLLGDIDNWNSLGGKSESISLVVHDHCPDYLEPMREALLGGKPVWSRKAMPVKTDQRQLETTSRYPGAIGVNSWILAEPFVQSGKLKLIGINGVSPTLANAATGKYPLVGPLILIYEHWDDTLHPFFSFLYSSAGRELIAKKVIPLSAHQAGYSRSQAMQI